MRGPTFLILGAQKAGTTWLARRLSQHPDVYVAPHEIHFFDKEQNFYRGRAWYEAHFDEAGDAQVIGEKTPDYLWANGAGAEGHLANVHHNVYSLYPDLKLIVVLRNPVLRAISALNHLICTGRVSPFHNIDELLVGKKAELVLPHGVIEKGLYYRQIQAYLELFARKQFLFLLFEEDIVARPEWTLAQVCAFLGVDDTFVFHSTERSENTFAHSFLGLAARYYLPIGGERVGRRLDRHLRRRTIKPAAETLALLYALYAEENRRLFEFLGRTPLSWSDPQLVCAAF